MNKLNHSLRPTPLMGTILGYTDQEKLIFAVLTVEDDKIIGYEFLEFWNIHHAMAHFV
jgi:hypothetical protein